MWRCPICEKEHVQGSVCDNCGFDSSCDYEHNSTLCSALPKHIEPISVRAAKWRQQQKQRTAVSLGNFVCPKCGGRQFFLLADELQFMCADCEVKMPITVQTDELVSECDSSAEKEAPDAPNDPPVGVSAEEPAQTMAEPEPEPELEPEPEPAREPEPAPRQKSILLGIMGIYAVVLVAAVLACWMEYRKAGPSVTWKLDSTGVMTISGSGEMDDFYNYNGGRPWNGRKDKITSVVVEPGVTTIGSSVFAGCTSLTSITLPESVTSIGGHAFSGCTSLTSVTIPNSVTYIGPFAFYKCTSLTSVTIPNSVTYIDDYAFYECTSLTDVYYGGTEVQWRRIKDGGNNDYLLHAAIHYNS